MSQWQIWLRSGAGETPSQELVAAMVGVSRRDMRHARRLIRHRQAAEDVAVARYTVALARERQRRLGSSRSARALAAACIALGLLGAGLAIYTFAQSQDERGAISGGFAAICLLYGWRGWNEYGNLTTAEQINRAYLQLSGAPYVPGGPPTATFVPPLAVAGSLAIYIVFIIAAGGFSAILVNEGSLSFARALSSAMPAAPGTAAAALFVCLCGQSRAKGRHVREYEHLRDLD
jgi:hypothetical protein